MAQEQVQKQKAKTRAEDTHTDESNVDVTNAELAESTEETLDSIEEVLADQDDMDLLADLDEVLGTEEEAQAMVEGFVQQGGE
jgi:hypothetical protein